MRLGIKQFLFLVNDLTGFLLRKEIDETSSKLEKFKKLFLISLILLVISAIINIVLLIIML